MDNCSWPSLFSPSLFAVTKGIKRKKMRLKTQLKKKQQTQTFFLTLKRDEPSHWFVESGTYIALRVKASIISNVSDVCEDHYLSESFIFVTNRCNRNEIPTLLLWFVLKLLALQWHSWDTDQSLGLLIKGWTYMAENYKKSVCCGRLSAKRKCRHLSREAVATQRKSCQWANMTKESFSKRSCWKATSVLPPKAPHVHWCLLGWRALLQQNPEVFACPDVNSHKGALLGRVKITEQKKMFCWKILAEKGLPAWTCEPGD